MVIFAKMFFLYIALSLVCTSHSITYHTITDNQLFGISKSQVQRLQKNSKKLVGFPHNGTSINSKQFNTGKLAVARTFCPNDIENLVKSFDQWEKLPPCIESFKKLHYSVDIILIFSQNLSESVSASKAITRLYEIFEATNGWNGCFDNFYAIDVAVEPSMDLYIPSEQMENKNWVNGPNRHFERSVRAIQQNDFGHYEYMYLMEGDSVPVKKYWLDALMDEIIKNRPFAILGSKYTGDKWDSFYDKLPISLVNHINGNAVYNITHPLLEILIQRLEDEANTPFNAIPYDYRISQIMAQAKTGTIPEIPPKIMESYDGKEWSESVPSIANVLTSVQRYISKAPIKQTSLIANYAATNIVTSHIGREHIIHGAVVYEELKRSSQTLTLVVSDWYGGNSATILSYLNKHSNPFSDVVVILPPSVQVPKFTLQDTSVTVHFYHRKESERDYSDLCSAPVSSKWFMMTNSFHRLVRKATIMMERGGGMTRPVIPFVDADYDNCYKFHSCIDAMKSSKLINSSFDNRYVVDFDMVYHTERRDEFCSFLNKRNSSNRSQRSPRATRAENEIEKSEIRPSASAYLAFIDIQDQINDIYKLVDKQKFGSRKMFVQVIPYPDINEQEIIVLDKNDRHHRFLQSSAENSTGCNVFDTKEDCLNGGAECNWRPNFSSCYSKNDGRSEDECTKNISPDSNFEYITMTLNGSRSLSPRAVLVWENVTNQFVSEYIKEKYTVNDALEMDTSLLCQNGVSDTNRRELQISPNVVSNTIIYKQRIISEFESNWINPKEVLSQPFQQKSDIERYITKLKEAEASGSGKSSEFGSLFEISDVKKFLSTSTSAPSPQPSKLPSLSPSNHNDNQISTNKLIFFSLGIVVGLIICIFICIFIIWRKIRRTRSDDSFVYTERNNRPISGFNAGNIYVDGTTYSSDGFVSIDLNDMTNLYDLNGGCIDEESNSSPLDAFDSLFQSSR